jgi:peptide/nickel transport system substrate-binding protein
MKKTMSVTAAGISMMFALIGCSGAGAGGDEEQVLVYGSTQVPRHLNPAVQSGLATMTPGAQLFAYPVRFEDSFEPIPYLAESWEVAEDGLTVTLDLVDDAVFHDGEPITSSDVAFSLNVVKEEHPFGASLYGPVESVDTPDEHTAVINLAQPHPALMIAMGQFLPVLPEHVYGSDDTVADHEQNSQDVVGSGPYTLAEHDEGKRITLEKFDDFFMDDAPTLDRIIMEIIPDENTLALALEKGEIHIMTTGTPSVITRLQGNDKVAVAEKGFEGLGRIDWLEFNTENEYLSDKRVRQAIGYAIDTRYIIEELHNGVGRRAPSAIHPESPYFSDDVTMYERDLGKAAQLLDQAGYEQRGDGKRFALSIDYIPANDETQKNVAEVIKANLAEVGVVVTVRAAPDFPTWAQRVSSYNYDMTMDNVWNWGDPVVGVARTYVCDNIIKGVVWSNMSQYCNDEVDRLFAEAAEATSEEERTQLYAEVQRILSEDLPIYWIEALDYRNVTNPDVQDAPNGIFGVMSPMLNVSLG